MGQVQRKSYQPESNSRNQLSYNHKNFFVRKSSRKGLHNGFNVQGKRIKDVQKVISLSSTSSPLNINTVTILSTTKGSPIAKYAVGTHDIGDFFFVLFIAKFLLHISHVEIYSAICPHDRPFAFP